MTSNVHEPPMPAELSGLLPHRPPFLFIDRIVEQSPGRIHVARTFRPEEDFFRGHFPGRPIVPGVLLLEMMAQAFACMTAAPGKGVYLTGVDRARFRKPVLPGQEVRVLAELTESSSSLPAGCWVASRHDSHEAVYCLAIAIKPYHTSGGDLYHEMRIAQGFAYSFRCFPPVYAA